MSSHRVKLPSFQFYPGDWLRDAGLRACTVASRGVWMDLLCFMHDAPTRGLLLKANGQPFTAAELARAVGCSLADLETCLSELEAAGVFDRREDGAIVSRRMASDDAARRQASDNGRMGGNPVLKGDRPGGLPKEPPPGQPDAKGGVNPPLKGGVRDGISLSSSSSSSSSSGGKTAPPPGPVAPKSHHAIPERHPLFARFWEAYPRKSEERKAATAFAEIVADDDEAFLQTMLDAIAWQKKSADWTDDGGKYIHKPANWLREAKWQDRPPEALAPPTPPEKVWDRI